ncbi:MAG: hypothetical protein H6577_01675 [Lewinellaceae bacterium]|nr:hypothetical protein [Saprospiraceae bacterium]MCB9336816.1 hypothetical protein [Lewinellaceae bacterium]
MKNLIYSVFALIVLSMAASCQKEDIVPQSTATTILPGETIGPGSTEGDISSRSDLFSPPSTPTWENWDLCGKPFVVSKQQLDGGRWVLAIHDQGMNQKVLATGISFDQLPNKVKQSLNNIFPGNTTLAQWQSVKPADSTYYIEYDMISQVVVLWMDAGGHLLCKGIHQ